MSKPRPQFSENDSAGHQQQPRSEEVLLWQEYSKQLSSIAGILSDSYWVSQGLSQLNLNDPEPLQSKTKQALRVMNSHNSKLELISKIIKNLNLCSSIEYDQEKLVDQLMRSVEEWENWRRLRLSKLNFDEGIFRSEFMGQSNENREDELQVKMQVFENDFDDRKLREFEQPENHEERDIEI